MKGKFTDELVETMQHDMCCMVKQLEVCIDALLFYSTQNNTTQQRKVASDRGIMARDAMIKITQIAMKGKENEVNSDNVITGGLCTATKKPKPKAPTRNSGDKADGDKLTKKRVVPGVQRANKKPNKRRPVSPKVQKKS